MFDIHANGLDLGTVFLILTPLLLLVQLLLCFKVKPLIIRLLPVLILAAITALSFIAAQIAGPWDNLGYAAMFSWTASLLIDCGIGWAVWGIAANKIH